MVQNNQQSWICHLVPFWTTWQACHGRKFLGQTQPRTVHPKWYLIQKGNQLKNAVFVPFTCKGFGSKNTFYSYLMSEMIWSKFHENQMLWSVETKLLCTLASWVKIPSPFVCNLMYSLYVCIIPMWCCCCCWLWLMAFYPSLVPGGWKYSRDK